MNMSSQKSRRSDKIKIEFPFTDHVIYSRVIYVIYRVVSIVVEIEHMAVVNNPGTYFSTYTLIRYYMGIK